jgi:Xaa-Pro aminopeptidase
VFDYAARQERLSERLEREGVDALFLAPSADLEYLTGVERQLPIFGEVNYCRFYTSPSPRVRSVSRMASWA